MVQKNDSLTIPPTDDAGAAILIEVAVPADMAVDLQERAGGRNLGDFMVEVCSRFGSYPTDDFRGIYLSGDARGKIESIIGRGIQSAEDLVTQLVRSKAVVVRGVGEVVIPDDVLELLKARFYGEESDYDPRKEVRKMLELAFERFRVQGV